MLQNIPAEDKCRLVSSLQERLQCMPTQTEKLHFLYSLPHVDTFIASSTSLQSFLNGLSTECAWCMVAIIAIGQGPVVFNALEDLDDKFEKLRALLHTLLEVEHFYQPIGGLIGYYLKALALLTSAAEAAGARYYYPPLSDISTANNDRHIRQGIEAMPYTAEVYPIGGAGDRLNLCHPLSGEPLPVAQLEFEGFSLLERLFVDLQAREYLYWKLHGQQLETPIVMMGSHEKDNISHLLELCQKRQWFGRAVDTIQMIVQPLVPQITEQGDFALKELLQLSLKPGGHGVLWKLISDEGVFDWLKGKGCQKILVRQINNPIASTDDTLLAFVGVGAASNYGFGFIGCDRRIGAPEGMLVLKQSFANESFNYAITNVEYTNFQAKGLEDVPKEDGSPFSHYPANTNILFADIDVLEKTLQHDPLPGLLINVKSKAPLIDSKGDVCHLPAGRLESSMQNVADSIKLASLQDIESVQAIDLPSYVAFAKRSKALSVTKNLYTDKAYPYDTPESCFFTQLENARELFSEHCHMELPPLAGIETYLDEGPPFIIRYTPLLGPLYHVIAQKIQKGTLHPRSELLLHIAELDIQGLDLAGSLKITAKEPFGCKDPVTGKIQYSHGGGKCQLYNVKVVNQGVDYTADNCYWKDAIQRHAQLEIILHGNGEFLAESVVFEGALRIEVLPGQRIEARMADGAIVYQTFAIAAPTWQWSYAFADSDQITLKRS